MTINDQRRVLANITDFVSKFQELCAVPYFTNKAKKKKKREEFFNNNNEINEEEENNNEQK